MLSSWSFAGLASMACRAQRSCRVSSRSRRSSRWIAADPAMHPADSSNRMKQMRRIDTSGVTDHGPRARSQAVVHTGDARGSPSATPHCRTAVGGGNSMLLLALLLAAPDDLADKLRHLNSAAAAWSPAPAPDASRVAFITTL